MSSAPLFFKTAAILNAISIPGHLLLGIQKVYPALSVLDAKHAQGKAAARVSWDNVHILLFINAVLNWQWAQTNGPQTLGEKLVVWSMMVAGLVASRRYFQVGEYGPLGCLFVAPVSTVIGTVMTSG